MTIEGLHWHVDAEDTGRGIDSWAALTRGMDAGSVVSSVGEGLRPVVSGEVEFEMSPVLEAVVAAARVSIFDSAPTVASA